MSRADWKQEQIQHLEIELAATRAESAGRLKALNAKAEEARAEWLRAERAEGRAQALEQKLGQARGLLGYVSAGEEAGLYYDRGIGWWACLYCEAVQEPDKNGEWGEFPHKPDCLITRARAMLGDT